MKTIKYLATGISVMVLASCSMEVLPVENEGNEVEKNTNLVEMTLTVSTEYNEDTKATFINYPKLGWEKGDKVSILGLLTGNQQFTADSKGNVSTFTGEADPNDDLYYGLYPYDKNVTITEDGVFENVIIPAVQTAGNLNQNQYCYCQSLQPAPPYQDIYDTVFRIAGTPPARPYKCCFHT